MQQEIRNAAGERLDASWHPGRGEGAASRPVLVLGHGVTANKDRPFLVALAEAAAAAGLDALRVSFAGNGASEGRFEEATVSKEVQDLGAALDSLAERPVVYAGHSMGAAVGVLRAVRDERIEALVSLAGMVRTQAFVERKFAGLAPGELMWDKPGCPLSRAFLDDMRAIGSVEECARELRLPWLLVHGDADTVVPLEESVELAEAGGEERELVVLPGVDHLFAGDGGAEMARRVVEWLRETGRIA